jgi:hypothetical protein
MSFWSGHFGFKNSSLAVATSASPSGPFVLAPPITLRGAAQVSEQSTLDAPVDGVVEYRGMSTITDSRGRSIIAPTP